ncbi:hypothetical protein [Sphingobacterium yanglingense]|uniref:Lipocalin-like protein n=1 Tax=Sphingobacterium yanglingense TaxID=1437280 RepID=A0A4R6WL83_9SPHI|nr:hypothetical protein [Sphingobacterium yanglingense]TDQ79482.1 hypothetical protein CLV99_0920 [Sphingobacterium yanglingense]
MKHLVASIILVMVVMSAQAQSIKSDIIGKWEVTKREFFNSKGKPDPKRPTETARESGYKTIYDFKKKGILEYSELGEFDADIRDLSYMVDGKVIMVTDKETYDIIWKLDVVFSESKKTIFLIEETEYGTERKTLVRR